MDTQISTKIAEGLYQIGPFFDNAIVAHASYVLIDDTDVILINPGSIQTQEKVYKEIETISGTRAITKIIVMNPAATHISSLPFFASKVKTVTILTEWRTKLLLESYGINAKYTLISKNRYKIKLHSGHILQFIKAPFLPSAGSFLMVDSMSKTLFSSELYSTYDGGIIDFSDDTHLESVLQYHETFLPSSDFVKPINNMISKLSVTRILTNTGSIYNTPEAIALVTSAIYKHEFYNTDFVVRNTPLVNRTYDYINILNQYLIRLYNVFDEKDIIQAFTGSEIQIDEATLQITSTTLKRRVLYNRFFDILYEKQGILWLNVLEASVNKVARKFYIPKPDIYKARSLELQEKVSDLESQNLRLFNRNEQLQKALEDTKDEMLKCPLTGLYNKQFFTHFLAQNLDSIGAVILIEIDDLEKLNRDYSYEVGDETIQHLHYQIVNQLPDNILVFRGDGSSFILYCSESDHEEILSIATTYRNLIGDANTFIEPITIGIGIVFMDEAEVIMYEKEQVLEQAYQRVNYAHYVGKGEIVYTSFNQEIQKDGALLLVDDDPYNIGVIQRICERENISMYQCFDMYEALEIVKTRTINIIVSEINLSKLDAFHLKSELNKSLTYSNIPFIVASHNKTKETIVRANALSIDYILNKPFYPEELLGILRRIIHQ